MAKTRVHDLAKEFGITSKEMLEHLSDMKIPAKSASSSLEEAYVSIIRKKLKPIIEAHAAEVEAQRLAAEEAKAAEEARAAEEAEKKRIEVEQRRERERLEEERKRKEKEERERVHDTAPRTTTSYTGLLDQIAEQEKILQQKSQDTAKKKDEQRSRRREAPSKEGSSGSYRPSRPGPRTSYADVPAEGPSSDSEGRGHGKGRKSSRHGQSEDRYSRMAREAEEYTHTRASHVFEEAREAIEEAHQSTGRRRKRKERLKQQQAEAAEEERVQEALKNDQDLSQLDTVRVPQGSTVADLA